MGLQDTPDDPAAIAAREAAARYYGDMEAHLERPRISRRRYSYADIAFYMAQLFGARMGAPMTEPSAAEAMARPDDGAAGGAPGRRPDGGVSRLAGRPLPDFMAAVHRGA